MTVATASKKAGLFHVLNLLRVHQWAKNLLIFVPLLLARQHDVGTLRAAILAFVAFSLVASSTYVLNDLVDATADRAHPVKKDRPLARGDIDAGKGIAAILILLAAGIAIALLVSLSFTAVLVLYYLGTTAYTFRLKRMLVIDVVAIGCFYTLRIIAGGVSTGIVISEWLLAFSVFFFLSLALMKRYSELVLLLGVGKKRADNRSYVVDDLTVLSAIAVAAAFNSVTVYAIFIGSPEVKQAYSNSQVLWLITPILIYWLARMMLLAHRNKITVDPVLFALRDLHSWACGLAIAILLLLAA
jgi:4-hydroxybenzoate polyprenyltransferase